MKGPKNMTAGLENVSLPTIHQETAVLSATNWKVRASQETDAWRSSVALIVGVIALCGSRVGISVCVGGGEEGLNARFLCSTFNVYIYTWYQQERRRVETINIIFSADFIDSKFSKFWVQWNPISHWLITVVISQINWENWKAWLTETSSCAVKGQT